jgi:hypothetical protein
VVRNTRMLEQINSAPTAVVYGQLVQLQHVRSGTIHLLIAYYTLYSLCSGTIQLLNLLQLTPVLHCASL